MGEEEAEEEEEVEGETHVADIVVLQQMETTLRNDFMSFLRSILNSRP